MFKLFRHVTFAGQPIVLYSPDDDTGKALDFHLMLRLYADLFAALSLLFICYLLA